MICGLISEGKKGRIYNHFQPISEIEYEKIQGTTVYIVDFGYSNDPTAVLEVKKVGNTRYTNELIYETGLDNLDLAKKLIDKGVTYKSRIYADYGAGGDLRIAELIRGYKNIEGYEMLAKGFNANPVRKGVGSIAAGVSLVKSHPWFITENSKNTWNEAGLYCWALDRDKNPTDQPIDKHNHSMDDIRYFDLIADYI
jgi:phage terminase large subunit